MAIIPEIVKLSPYRGSLAMKDRLNLSLEANGSCILPIILIICPSFDQMIWLLKASRGLDSKSHDSTTVSPGMAMYRPPSDIIVATDQQHCYI